MSTTTQYVIPLVLLAVTWLIVGVAAFRLARRRGLSVLPMRRSAGNADAWLASLTGSGDSPD